MRALALDDTLAQAHATLATVRALYKWNWTGAEREFAISLALDPDCPTAHHWFGLVLLNTGQIERAAIEVDRAHDLDPLSLTITANVGRPLLGPGWREQEDGFEQGS